jgi:hypothetical protein
MIARQKGAINLVIALALFDTIGEFVAQGTVTITITVSFLVAIVLLIVAIIYRRRERREQCSATQQLAEGRASRPECTGRIVAV